MTLCSKEFILFQDDQMIQKCTFGLIPTFKIQLTLEIKLCRQARAPLDKLVICPCTPILILKNFIICLTIQMTIFRIKK